MTRLSRFSRSQCRQRRNLPDSLIAHCSEDQGQRSSTRGKRQSVPRRRHPPSSRPGSVPSASATRQQVRRDVLPYQVQLFQFPQPGQRLQAGGGEVHATVLHRTDVAGQAEMFQMPELADRHERRIGQTAFVQFQSNQLRQSFQMPRAASVRPQLLTRSSRSDGKPAIACIASSPNPFPS